MMVVVWHIDDFKVSHKDPFEVIKFETPFSSFYGNEIKVYMRKVHDYLGMDLHYSNPGVLKSSMVNYLQKLLEKWSEELIGTSPTSTEDHLIQVREE